MEGRTKRVPCPICIRIRLRSLCNRGELTPEVPLNGLGSLHDIRAKRGFGFMDFVVSHSNGERHTWWGWEFKGVAPCLITYIQFLYTKTCASLIVYHTVNGWYRKPTLHLASFISRGLRSECWDKAESIVLRHLQNWSSSSFLWDKELSNKDIWLVRGTSPLPEEFHYEMSNEFVAGLKRDRLDR